MRDLYSDSINAPAGRLAEILLKKSGGGEEGREIPTELLFRFNRLSDAPGKVGKLARVRLAADVVFLFGRAPEWTIKKVVPLFDWSSADASDVWQARKYSRFIGSPVLFSLTKVPFLQMFGRSDVSADDIGSFSEWLAALLLANKRNPSDPYPLSGNEARSAVRRAGARALSNVGHRLALEMEAATPAEKIQVWRDIVGPVLQEIWPLDVEMRSGSATFKLVQILHATGDAFPQAADIIISLIQPDERESATTIFSISNAPNELYASAPGKILDLLFAVVGDVSPRSVYALDKALSRIKAAAPHLSETRKFQKLNDAAAA